MPNNVPEPPLRVLASFVFTAIETDYRDWEWVYWDQLKGQFVNKYGAYFDPDKLEVMPHPMNDPAAVELIEKSKERA